MGNVELNPGPKHIGFLVCHFKLNCTYTHNYAKAFVLKAFITIH